MNSSGLITSDSSGLIRSMNYNSHVACCFDFETDIRVDNKCFKIKSLYWGKKVVSISDNGKDINIDIYDDTIKIGDDVYEINSEMELSIQFLILYINKQYLDALYYSYKYGVDIIINRYDFYIVDENVAEFGGMVFIGKVYVQHLSVIKDFPSREKLDKFWEIIEDSMGMLSPELFLFIYPKTIKLNCNPYYKKEIYKILDEIEILKDLMTDDMSIYDLFMKYCQFKDCSNVKNCVEQ